MGTKKKKEIEVYKSNDIILASSQLIKRGLEIISELVPRRIYVPNDYPTITEAIDSALDGDTIELAEGNYQESLHITKPITIIGASPGRVILESSDLGPIVTYHDIQGISRIKNIFFRKTSKQKWLYGIDANGKFFEFEDCYFFGNHNDKYEWESYGPRAVRIGQPESEVKFLHCNFVESCVGLECENKSNINLVTCNFTDCQCGIDLRKGAHIELSNCNFTSTIESPENICGWNECKIKSNMCFFSDGVISLVKHTNYESGYDTFLDVEELIDSGDCQATFSHATIVTKCLLRIGIEGNHNAPKNPVWKLGKPKFHFSNSIVVVKNGYRNKIVYTPSGTPKIYYNGSSIINLAAEGILSYSDTNLLSIPPYIHCQDPLLIIEKNVARLSANSPAIKTASDGTNVGAWQGK